GLLAWGIILLPGCADPDAVPIIDFDGGLGLGAFPRLQEIRSGAYDLNDLNNSTYVHEVDFVDGAAGVEVAEYRILVGFDDNNPENGDESREVVTFRTFGPEDFAVFAETGNLGMTLNLGFTEVAGALNVTAEDVLTGDRFRFRTEILKEDGRVFSSTNSTPAVTNAFGGIWNWDVLASCPLPDDMFVGSYSIDYGYVYDECIIFDEPVTPFGVPLDRTVTFVAPPGQATRRTFNYGPYMVPGYNFSTRDIQLDFACTVLTHSNIDSGAGCGAGSIQATQTGAAPFDLADDTTFEVEFIDFAAGFDGGCGLTPKAFSIVFTKE
ncbi:MAG: hypothetical protein AAF597_09890, partial [Bacteroidota bacterium]